MNLFKLIIKEAGYRSVSTLIILLTVIIATLVAVSIFSMSKASEDETRKIMREQGLNLFLFPKGTETIDFFSYDYSSTFDEEYVDILANSETFDAVRHLVGMLQLIVPGWEDPQGRKHNILLVGYKDEAVQPYLNRQETMGTDVERGTVRLGFDIARFIPEEHLFQIRGEDGNIHEFLITERMQEGRGMLDQGVAMNLQDMQGMMNLPGKINKIEALGCVCHDGRVINARRQINQFLPDVEVKELSSIANARENQRLMMNKYGSFIIPFVIFACLLITGFLFYENVKSRKYEIGVLMALGSGNGKVISLILGKAFMLGLTGAILGFFAGTGIADYFGREVFEFTAQNIHPRWNMLLISMALSPFIFMLVSWIPALIAVRWDPAKILSEQ